MSISYGKRKYGQWNVIYLFITAILIFAVFLSMFGYFYRETKSEAYEMLHMQTKQIKDDLTLQIKSDRENLLTMAHFASKLYADGESYDIMFESFEPIGLLSNIGILNPDNTFVTRMGSINLDGRISFEDEARKGKYISGRIDDLTRKGMEIIRTGVPIISGGKTVGMLYGVIRLGDIGEKYSKMARELDAQLFVYSNDTGNFIVNSINHNLGNVYDLKDRTYNEGYSFDDIINSSKGYSSFKSIYRDEDLYVHYSAIEDFDWTIMLARYDSQVFGKMHKITNFVSALFFVMIIIIVLYFVFVLKKEKRTSIVVHKSSEIRRLLLSINQNNENISKSLENIVTISNARSAIYVDIEGEDYNFVNSKFQDRVLAGEDRKYFISELFKYAAEINGIHNATMGVISLKTDENLKASDSALYEFLVKQGIELVIFAAVTNNNSSNVSVLGVINPKNIYRAKTLLEEVSVCFSVAIYNKSHLNRTYAAASTDSLTGAFNRVAYKKDIVAIDEEKPEMFSCIYIDANGLHILNSKFGHAAGDEMLIFIANALKSIFYGHKVYRMGGDEFLVFVRGVNRDTVKNHLDVFSAKLASADYNVAIGVSYRAQSTDVEEMVNEAEKRMYEAKAQYYQDKESISIAQDEDVKYVQIETGIKEIDTMISVLKDHYNGIYRVSLDTDSARRILMPSYLGYKEDEDNFSKLMTKYIDDTVHPDYHRAVMSFLNYSALKMQLTRGTTPSITYKKANGETVTLSVYNMDKNKDIPDDTLWVFAKN